MSSATEELQTAVFGIELSDSEAAELHSLFLEEAAGDSKLLESLCECMLSMDTDASDTDVKGHNYNPGYPHALGIEMGASSYADAPKLAAKPPSKFAKQFDSAHKAHLAKIGVKRRAKGILVTQQRMA